jgi:hypothetical protein
MDIASLKSLYHLNLDKHVSLEGGATYKDISKALTTKFVPSFDI